MASDRVSSSGIQSCLKEIPNRVGPVAASWYGVAFHIKALSDAPQGLERAATPQSPFSLASLRRGAHQRGTSRPGRARRGEQPNSEMGRSRGL